MNPLLIMQGLKIVNQLRGTLSKGEKKPAGGYDDLRATSASISDLRTQLENLDRKERVKLSDKEAAKRREARAEAGPVTQAAHVRLENRRARLAQRLAAEDAFDFEKAKDRLTETAQEARQGLFRRTKKQSAKVQKAAEKARKQAEKKARRRQQKKGLRGVGIGAAILSLLAAIGAGVYYFLFLRTKEEPATTPPRVEEHSGEQESKLVYQTSTDKPAGDLAEDPAVRDEELLGSIDSQLESHRRGQEAVAEASEGADQAAERLRLEQERAEREFNETLRREDNS